MGPLGRPPLRRRARCCVALATFGAALAGAPVAGAQPAAADAGAEPASSAGALSPAAAAEGGAAAGDDAQALRAAVESLQKEVRVLKDEQAAEQAVAAASGASAALDVDAYRDRLKIYGFMDMGFQYLWYPDRSGLQSIIESRATTFVLGDINLFVDARPAERWRALTEVRLTNYPNGTYSVGTPGQPFARTSTTIQDTNSASGGWSQINWGSIVLERAHIDYAAADWLTIRTGYWFTPYGIWNVDHAAPTLIPLAEPYFVLRQAFPQQQLGVELTGTFRPGRWDLEYSAYVSNGRTPGQVNLTNDKMVGGRLILRRLWNGNTLALGASGYWGTYSDFQPALTSFTPLTYSTPEVVAYEEGGVGADVSLDIGKLRLRSELVVQHRTYEQGKRDAGIFPGSFEPDFTLLGVYVLASYRLPVLGLEPYLYFEHDEGFIPLDQNVAGVSGGLNIHFTPWTELKLQYQYIRLYDSSGYYHRDNTGDYTHFAESRLVVAF